MTVLTFDDTYIEQHKRLQLIRSQNFLHGIQLGKQLLVYDIMNSIRGLYLYPKIGISQGCSGISKGVIKGLLGTTLFYNLRHGDQTHLGRVRLFG